MPEFPEIQRLRRSLVARGLPREHASRAAAEVEAHLDDLFREALEREMAADAAREFARSAFGDMDHLAADMASRLRNSTWFGRHRLAGFILLPVMSFSAIFLLLIMAGAATGDVLGLWHSNAPTTAAFWLGLGHAVRLAHLVLLALTAAVFHQQARRSCCGVWTHAGIAGALVVHGLVHQVGLRSLAGGHHLLLWNYGVHVDLLVLAVPLMVLLVFSVAEWFDELAPTLKGRSAQANSARIPE